LTTSVLATKLHIPPFRPSSISRPVLLDALEKGLTSKLTLISAPAGFGKTTILSEWAQKCERPFTWFSVDERDNDHQRFFIHFIAAMQRIEADIGITSLESLQAPQFPPLESFLTGMINEISGISIPFVLVLDDYHLISDRLVHEGLIFLVENLPPQLHLVISGRADPPWPTARLRAQGMMNEIRTSDLRFSSEEVAQFLLDVMALRLTSKDISALEARTEGWIAGLQMAALSMKGRRDISSFIRSFTGSHRFIMDYLVEEILEGQNSNIQNFLLKTSILDQMTAGLCNAMVEGMTIEDQEVDEDEQESIRLVSPISGQQILEYLEHANLFVIPLDDERKWYRYHHLFSQLLQSRLKQVYPGEVAELHLRASRWFENVEVYDQAISHAFAAENTKRAADLVEQNAMNMITRSELGALSKWLDLLPDEILRSRPWLCTYQAWIKYWHGPRVEVEGWLEAAETALQERSEGDGDLDWDVVFRPLSEDEKNHIAGQIAAIRAYGAIPEGDYELVAQMAEEGLSLLPDGDFAQSVCAVALGAANRGKGDVAAALDAFDKAKEYALKRGNRQQAITAYCYYGEQQIKQGALHDALRTFEEALKVAEMKRGKLIGSAGFPLVSMADLYREWNELDRAEELLSKSIDIGLHWGIADFVAMTYIVQSRLQLIRGDLQGVWNTIQKADQLEGRMKIDPWVHTSLDECRLRFWLTNGDLSAVKRWFNESGLKIDGELSYFYDLHHLNLARVLIALGKEKSDGGYLKEAVNLIIRILESAERAKWIHETIKTLILQSLAYDALGESLKAIATLKRALELAQPGDYVRVFLDEGPLIVGLLEQLRENEEVGGYAVQLLTSVELDGGKRERREILHLASYVEPSPQLVEGLTEREIEVLRLLRSGLTSTDIAEELVIAVSTVRTHLKNLYSKLDVHSRMEAIQRAEELGLL
jgi:LuxR family maltose regulon positive regulatory protein